MGTFKDFYSSLKEASSQGSLKDVPAIANILYKATVRWFDELAQADSLMWYEDQEEGDYQTYRGPWPYQQELDFFAENFKDNSEKLSNAKTIEDLAKLVKNIVLSVKDASSNVEYKDSYVEAFKFAKEPSDDQADDLGYNAISELANVDPEQMPSILKEKQEELENGVLALHLA